MWDAMSSWGVYQGRHYSHHHYQGPSHPKHREIQSPHFVYSMLQNQTVVILKQYNYDKILWRIFLYWHEILGIQLLSFPALNTLINK